MDAASANRRDKDVLVLDENSKFEVSSPHAYLFRVLDDASEQNNLFDDHPDVVDLLLAAHPGAASVMVQGRTPLHYAVSHGCDVRVTKALVRLFPDACACVEIKFYGAFALNHRTRHTC